MVIVGKSGTGLHVEEPVINAHKAAASSYSLQTIFKINLQ